MTYAAYGADTHLFIHSFISVLCYVLCLEQDFLDLLQEHELRALLAGGGASSVESLRTSASYSSPVHEAELHVEVGASNERRMEQN